MKRVEIKIELKRPKLYLHDVTDGLFAMSSMESERMYGATIRIGH